MANHLTCPKCGERMTLNFATNRVMCQHCGYIRPDEIAALENTTQTVKSQPCRPVVQITHRGEIDANAMAAFETGQDWLYKGEKQKALESFLRAADYQEDFADAYLWAAKVIDDPKQKRDYLGNILAHNPTHLEALRMLMVLDGRLTPEQVAKTYHDENPQVKAIDSIQAQGTELLCPSCGGHLTEVEGHVECRFCGYSGPQTTKPIGEDVLAMALLERKANPVRWNIGKRVIQCKQCGAEHTIPAEKMSQRCRFCGSTQVIINDVLRSFEQPDCLLPFRLSAEDALDCIDQRLNSLGERIVGFFNNNKIARHEIDGVYLPFWVFDVNVDLTQTRTLNLVTETYPAGMDIETDVTICAVKSPPPALTRNLGGYVLSGAVPYEPKWLAKYPAQLYAIDFDKASLEAREIVSKRMRAKHNHTTQNAEVEELMVYRYERQRSVEIIRITSQIQSMTFQLALLPVWIATLIEQDGDIRLALVNGQTGNVALGKAYKLLKQ